MDFEYSIGSRTIQEAVNDGLLIEVTETAEKVGMPYRTFLTPYMLASYESEGPDRLRSWLLLHTVSLFATKGRETRYGPIDCGDHVYLLEPHEEYGHVMILAEMGKLEELDLVRTTGDRAQFAM
jgi:hypothetical protein